MDHQRKSRVWRSAAGAALLSVVLGAVAWQRDAGATLGSGERPATISVTPFRLVDTRPAPDGPIGGAAAPFGQEETRTYTVAGVGSVPADATGVLVNITALNATTGTFLTAWPAGTTMPLASTLNPAPGPVTFNAAVVDLKDKKMSVFNKAGSVDVIIDVTGYLVDHNHDDRYLEQSEPVVIGETAGAWRTVSTATPVFFEVLGPVMAGSGDLTPTNKTAAYILPLTRPAEIGGTQYQLSEVEYCVRAVSNAANVRVSNAAIFSDNPNPSNPSLPLTVEVTDATIRDTVGCYSVSPAAKTARSYSFVLSIALVGGATTGTVLVSGVQSTWTPVAADAAATTESGGEPVPQDEVLTVFPELQAALAG